MVGGGGVEEVVTNLGAAPPLRCIVGARYHFNHLDLHTEKLHQNSSPIPPSPFPQDTERERERAPAFNNPALLR